MLLKYFLLNYNSIDDDDDDQDYNNGYGSGIIDQFMLLTQNDVKSTMWSVALN